MDSCFFDSMTPFHHLYPVRQSVAMLDIQYGGRIAKRWDISV